MQHRCIPKTAPTIFLSIVILTIGTSLHAKNISLDCDFPRGFQLDYFKERHPDLFDTSKLIRSYSREGLPIPEKHELELAAEDFFLFVADLKIRSMEIEKNFGNQEFIELGRRIIRLPSEEVKWTTSHLQYVKHMPAFSIRYSINRSKLSYFASYSSFPPLSNELIFWQGTCIVVAQPERKF